MSTGWFNDRPLHLETVCTRLREAVEERENFFGFDPGKCAASPLDITRPCRTDDRNSRPATGTLADFAANLTARIKALANFAYPPDNLGKFSTFYRSPARGGWEWTNIDPGELDAVFDSLGVEPADFHMRRPFCFRDMRFFNACAEILNRYILYPLPPGLNGNSRTSGRNTVFHWNFSIDVTDLDNGTHISHDYVQHGSVTYRSSRGTYRIVSDNRIAEWIRNDLKIQTANYRFHYDPALGSANDIPVDFAGEFQFEIPYVWSFFNDGVMTIQETLPEIYTISSGGTADAPFPESWQHRIDDVPDGDDELTSALIQRNVNPADVKIKLDQENYPALPYKYLT